MEALLANHSLSAQEWIFDVDEVDPKTVNKDLGIDDNQAPRESPRTREPSDGDFKSESEEQVLEEDEYEFDEVQILESPINPDQAD
ncbi:unnamed protein product [Lactuca saligna]|uniref:Uncharacterized protein n=1 Tax=Lactuca saligna TaxID=75948 RepID=A0AA35Y5H9_LACSI|nr:unnamed protein product [Lactuca saligna]